MNEDQGIAIVGAGAIGCRMAAHLSASGRRVTLFDGWAAHVETMRRSGLWFEAAGERTRHAVDAHGFDEPVPASTRFGTVLVAVRGDATAEVMPLVSRLLAPGGCVVSCQNGINEETIAEHVGVERTLGCSMIFGARLVGPGIVEALRGEDTLCVGEMAGPPTTRTLAVRDLLATCGTTTTTDDLLAYRWKKLVFNCMGNPLTLLTGQVARDLHANHRAREVMIGIARETLATARACGVEPEAVLGHPPHAWLADLAFADEALHRALIAHGDYLGERRFSMWADFQQRGRTEVDALNGYVARRAASVDVSAPLNAQVVELVHRLELGRPMPPAEVIDALNASIATR